jgi:hypothetical protein
MTTARPGSLRSPAAWHGVHRLESDRAGSAAGWSLPTDRRGRLKNGNRSGDFLAAPRCGARTRCGGACRQPAMPNGRCRLHGGLSTGPRTPAGLARSRRARWKHGACSAPVRTLLREARLQSRRTRALRARVTGSSAGHGVDRSKSTTAPGMSASKIHHRGHRGHRETILPTAGAARIRPSSVRSVSSVVKPSSAASAGHGVHRPISRQGPSAGIRVHLRSPAAKSASSAWHGVLRSFRDCLCASASLSAIRHVLRSPAATNR